MPMISGFPFAASVAQQAKPAIDKRRYIGSMETKVIVEEYFSASCPHCRTFHEEVFPTIKKEYIDTGRIGWQLRDFPLDRDSLLIAKIARCAPEGYYSQVTDVFLQLQNRWLGQGVASIEAIALEAGFSKDTIDACLKNQEIERDILKEVVSAQKIYGVNSTPSFVINGELQKGGASLTNMRLILSRALRA